MAWISFGALPCKGGKKLMTARVLMLLKSSASLTYLRACFFPGRAKDLTAAGYIGIIWTTQTTCVCEMGFWNFQKFSKILDQFQIFFRVINFTHRVHSLHYTSVLIKSVYKRNVSLGAGTNHLDLDYGDIISFICGAVAQPGPWFLEHTQRRTAVGRTPLD